MPVPHLRNTLLCALLLAAVPACAPKDEPPAEADFAADPLELQIADFKTADPFKFGQGEAMAETICSACHAITLDDMRPNIDAPAFRDLAQSHDLSALAERFENGIMTGHPSMPEFQFEPEEVESLIYYISALQSAE